MFKKFIYIFVLILCICSTVFAADTELANMTNDASPTDDDLIYSLNDPAGTKGDRKVTWANLWAYIYANITTTIGSAYDTSAELDALFAAKQDTITFGTNVETALGVNIGSAGAVVLFNGDAGTPSAIVLTNGTSLPISTGLTGSLAELNTVLSVTLLDDGDIGGSNATGLTTGDNYTNFGGATDDSINEMFAAIDASWPSASGAPTDAHYWTDQAEVGLSAEVVVNSAATLESAANLGAYASDILSVVNEAGFIALMPNYVDQDVTSGAAPTFSATNFSDGGTNIIPTSAQETNWDDAYTRTGNLWNDRTALTGGAAGALDELSVSDLTDNDLAIVRTGTQALYVYLYDADATAAESSPNVIRPDDYATQGNWELQLYISDGVIQLSALDMSGGTTTLGTVDGSVTMVDGANFTLSDNNHIAMDATADGMDDDEYNGDVITGRACGEGLTQWDTVRLANDADPWHQADANAAGEFPAIGISVAACTDTNAATILVRGVVRNEGWTGLTPGGAVYLSTTAGGLTQTAPSTSGDAVQIIGWALSDSEIYFDFSRPYSEVQ